MLHVKDPVEEVARARVFFWTFTTDALVKCASVADLSFRSWC